VNFFQPLDYQPSRKSSTIAPDFLRQLAPAARGARHIPGRPPAQYPADGAVKHWLILYRISPKIASFAVLKSSSYDVQPGE
jgi:hypothetical protein